MKSRFLRFRIVFLLFVLFVFWPGGQQTVYGTNYNVSFDRACIDGVINSSELLSSSPSVPVDLLDKGVWIDTGGLDFSNTSYSAEISGFTGSGPYYVEFRLHNGDSYFYTITAPVTATSFLIESGGSSSDILLSGSDDYPVTFNVSSGGTSYTNYYKNLESGVVNTSSAIGSAWNFNPADDQSVYSVYSVVTHTVSGNVCKSVTNSIDVSKDITIQVVGGGSVCQTGSSIELEVVPYSTDYSYEWDLPSGGTSSGSTYNVNLFNPNSIGDYTVRAISNMGGGLVATSDPVSVGAYDLSASISPSGSETLCEGSTINLQGSAVHPDPSKNLDYQWVRNGEYESLSSNGYNVVDTRSVSEGGEFVFRVQESSNPLCYATSAPTLVQLEINANPMYVTGSDACIGSSINDITLEDSEVGITYRLVYDNGSSTSIVEEWTSTADDEKHIFSSVSAIGSYSVEADGCSGTVQMNGGPFVISDLPKEDLPVILTGSGCAGSTHSLTVQNSESDVTYQIFRGSNIASIARVGNGGDLVFSGLTVAGDYEVRASRNGCSVTLDDKNRIGTVPEDQTFSPITSCAGIPFTLTLDDTQSGVEYNIFNITDLNNSLYSEYSSVGGPVSFIIDESIGTYVIIAENADGCTREIGEFSLQSPPITSYTLFTDDDPACSLNGPHELRLSDSQPGFVYRLMRGSTVLNTVTAPATGGVLVLGSTSVAGTYTVSVSNSGCELPMSTSLTIVAQPNNIPVVSQNFCAGEDVEIRLNTSQNDAFYRLYRNGVLYDSEQEVEGNGNPIVFSDKFPAGFYTIGASFVTGACERIMTGEVVVNELPDTEIDPFNDYYCADAVTATIGGRPQVGTSDWWVSGFATNPTWFTENDASASIDINDLLSTHLGASDRVSMTFNYSYEDPVTGCEAVASESITFVDDQRDNLDFLYRMDASDPWVNFSGDLLTCQSVDDILLQARFLDDNSVIGSGVFTTNAPTGSITNAGSGDEGAATFHPNVAGNGLWSVVYTYIDNDSGCEASISYNIQVGTTLTLEGLSAQYCASNDVAQQWYGTPVGGELIIEKLDGTGSVISTESSWPSDVNPFLFTPNTRDPGEYNVTYRFTSDPGGANECSNEITQTIVVRDVLDASFDTSDGRRIFCVTNGDVVLDPVPASGSSYSGTGVGGGIFRPAVAGIGTHRVTRTVQDGFCSSSEWLDFEVVEPDVAVVLDQYEFCYNDDALFPVEASNMPVISGVYSRDEDDKSIEYTFSTDMVNSLFRFEADGVTRNYGSSFNVKDGDEPVYFDPSRVPAIGGSDINFNIYLEYSSPVDEGGCEVYTAQPILVKSVPEVNFGTTEPMEFCQNSSPVILEGRYSGNSTSVGSGYFSADFFMDNQVDGSGTENNGRALFDPSLVTPSSAYEITYYYENSNGCVSSRTKSFEIKAAPIKQRVIPVDPNGGIFCEGGDVTIGLQGTEDGVRYVLQKDGVDVDESIQFIDGVSPGNTTQNFPLAVTEPGVYTVRAEMIGIADGCDTQMEGSVVVSQTTVVGVLESLSHESCSGSSDGSIIFSAYGGTGSYTYTLRQGAIDVTTSASGEFSGLSAGIYTVHIEDVMGCNWTSEDIEVQAGSVITVTNENIIDVVCYGQSDGAFTVLADGLLSGNYEFQLSGSSAWLSNGTGRYVFDNLPEGTYDVTVRDADNPACQAVMPTVEIDQPDNSVSLASVNITPVDCSLGAEGELEVLASGGDEAGGFNYVLYKEQSSDFWVNISSATSVVNGTSHTFDNLFAGTYRVVASDSRGCSVTEEYIVDGPTSLPGISLSGDEVIHVSQPGFSDGAIEIAVAGGIEPYNILWEKLDGPGGTADGTVYPSDVLRQEGLDAGVYRITVTDDNNCLDILEVEVLEDAVNIYELNVTTVNPGPCYGSSNGRINIRAVGGLAPYTSLLLTNGSGDIMTAVNSGNSFANYNNLPAGDYTATVIDSRGVALNKLISLTEPSAPVTIDYSVTDASCYGTNGNLIFSVSGGNAFDNGTEGDITDDYYNFTILSSGGIALVSEKILVTETINVENDFSVFDQLPADDYQLTVSDAVSCFEVVTFSIQEPEKMSVVVDEKHNNLCYGVSDGSISVSVDGRPGGSSFVFDWEIYDDVSSSFVSYANDASATINDLPSGIYRVKAKEITGDFCESEFSGNITITQPSAALDVVVSAVDVTTCNGDATGSIRLSVMGGTAPYTVEYGTQTNSWDGLNDYVVDSLFAGTYDFTITDVNGCVDIVNNVVISEPDIFQSNIIDYGIDCETSSSGWIDLNVAGGVDNSGFSYWVQVIRIENNQYFDNQLYNNPAGGLIQITGLPSGKYTVRVWDANSNSIDGCRQSFEIELSHVAVNSDIIQPSCSGLDNGSIAASVSGGSGDYSYSWTKDGSALSQTGSELVDLEPGVYELTVHDNINNCNVIESYTLAYSYNLDIDIEKVDISCFGGSDGKITVMPSGGSEPYFYLWERYDGSVWIPLVNTAVLTNREAGVYRVTVTDANNCTITSGDIDLIQPVDFNVNSISYSRETVSCYESTDGSFTVNTVGPGIFQFSIDGVNWQSSPVFDGLSAGSYLISIRNLDSPFPYCTKYDVATATILEADSININLVNQVDIQCYNDASGLLEVGVSGGSAPYSYQWYKVISTGNIPQSGKTDFEASGLSSGEYFVEVIDNNNCIVTSEKYSIAQPASAIEISEVSRQNVTANGGNDGSITIAISGGTPGYTINWYEGDDNTGTGLGTGLIQGGLAAGNYTVEVFDNSASPGCSVSETFTITQPNTPLSMTESLTHPNPCYGDTNGIIELNVTGGTGGYNFTLIKNPTTEITAFSSSFNNAIYNNLSSGFYTARVQDSNGIVFEIDNIELVQPEPLEIFNFSSVDISCNGQNDGSINFSIRGGTPDVSPNEYSYILSGEDGINIVGSGALNITESGLKPGDYSLEVFDATNVCSSEYSFTITEPDAIVIVETISDVTCYGDDNGSIRIDVDGGVNGAYSYEWESKDAAGTWTVIASSNTAWLQNQEAGFYRVKVTELGAGSCSIISDEFEIKQPEELIVNAIASDVNTCKGDNSGRIKVVVSGGVSPYMVDYGNGVLYGNGPEFFIENLSASDYTIFVTDNNGAGCQTTVNVTVNEPAAELYVTEPLVSINCDASNTENFSVSFDISGGVAKDNGSGNEFLYNIDVVNIQTSGRKTKTVIRPIVDDKVSVNLDDLFLIPGQYSIVVTDLNAETSATCATIETSFNYSTLVVSGVVDSETCSGAFDGSIDLAVSGGSGSYSYSWLKDGVAITENTQDLSGLEAGIYTVTISDNVEINRCSYETSFTVAKAKELMVEASVQNVSCYNGNNGYIRINGVSNATEPVSYFWNGSSVAGTNELSGLSAGDYSVEVIDGDGCRIQKTFTIGQPTTPVDAILSSELDCTNDVRSISVVASGGTAGVYSYQWMGPGAYTREDDGKTITGITAGGTWQVEVTDIRGCKVIETIDIDGKMTISADITDISCNGGSGGTIDVDVVGGSGNYIYEWTKDGNPITLNTKALVNQDAGQYQVVVTDLNQICSDAGSYSITSAIFEIKEPDVISVDKLITNNECYGEAQGQIILSDVSGGTAPYTFIWTTGNGSGLIPGDRDQRGLTSGNYSVRVVDDLGCSSEKFDFEITELPELSFDLNFFDTDCNGDNSITVSNTVGGSGNVANYKFFWDGPGIVVVGDDVKFQENLPGGIYTVTMMDIGTSSGCAISKSVELVSPMELTYSVEPETCPGSSDGSIVLDVVGGVEPYVFTWEVATGIEVDQANQSGLLAGTYRVTVTDGRSPSCSIADFEIEVPLLHNQMQLSATVKDIGCFGANDGEISASIFHGSGNYTYEWTKGGYRATTPTINSLDAGIYHLEVVDVDYGCTMNHDFEVTQPDEPLSIKVDNITPNVCFGEDQGSIDISVEGGTGSYAFLWNGPGNLSNPTSQNQTGLSAGDYYVTVTDANNCTLTYGDAITIIEPASSVNVSLVEVTPVTAKDQGDGTITINVSGGTGGTGGTGPYSIVWTSDNGTDMTGFEDLTYADGLNGGTYTISVTDGNGCAAEDLEVIVFEPGQDLSLDIKKQASGPCYGSDNGKIIVSVQGGVIPYQSLSLSDGSGVIENFVDVNSATFDNLKAGDYSVTVEDAYGNIISQDVSIYQVNSPLSLTATATKHIDCVGDYTGEITVTVTGGISDKDGKYKLELYGGPSGTFMSVEVIADAITGEATYIFENLPKGTYSVRVVDDSNVLLIDNSEVADSDLQNLFGDDDFNMTSDCSANVEDIIVREPQALINLSVETGSEEVCFGQAPKLVASTSGWSFSDGNLNITLSNGDAFELTSASEVLEVKTLPVDAITTYTVMEVSSVSAPTCFKGVGMGKAVVVMNELPTASLSGNSTICAGELAELTIQLTGTSPWRISYEVDGNTYWINDITTPTYIMEVTPVSTATYTLKSVEDANCVGTVTGTAKVTVPVVSTVSFEGEKSRSFCAGNTESLSVKFAPVDNGPWQLTYSEQEVVNGVPVGSLVMKTVTVTDAMLDINDLYSFDVTPLTTTRYRLESVVSGGCEGIIEDLPVYLIVDDVPSQPGSITGPIEVCQGASATYTIAELSNVSTYIWVLPDGTEISSTNSLTINFSTDSESGRLYVKGHNNCGDGPVQYIDITVNKLPDTENIDISGPDYVCQGTKEVSFSVEAVPYATSYEWILPASWNVDKTDGRQILLDIPDEEINYPVVISVIAKNDCGVAEDLISHTFTVQSNPLANAGPDDSVCDNKTFLDATAVGADETGKWSSFPISGFADEITDLENPKVEVTNLSRGDVTFRWTVTDNTYGCTSYDDVTIRNNTLDVSASADMTTVCDGTTTLRGTPGNSTLNIAGQWTVKEPISSTVSFSDASSNNVDVVNMPVGENIFVWTLTQNGCESSAEVVVNNSQPDEAVIEGPKVIATCGDDVTLKAQAVTAGWGIGQWSLKSGYAKIESPDSETTLISDIAQGSVEVVWTVTKGNCSNSASVIIRNDKLVVNAGSDQDICSSSTILEGDDLSIFPSGVIGSWHVIQGNASFVDGNSSTTQVNNLSRGVNVLEWRLTNNGCESSDQVIITNNMATVATVGSQELICGDTYILTGNDPVTDVSANINEIGYWSHVSGGGVFDDPSDPETEITGIDYGENIYRWTINNNNKCSSYADLKITNLKTSVDAGRDTIVCDNTITLRGNEVPDGMVGTWTVVSGEGSATVGVIDSSMPHIALAAGLGEGNNTFSWVIENQGCYSEDRVVVVNNRPYPVDAGSPERLVNLSEIYMEAEAVSSPMIGTWTLQSGGGVIIEPNNPTTKVTELRRGENVFRWVVTNGNCSDYKEVLIVNGDVVEAEAGRPQTICGSSTFLEANEAEGAIGSWSVIQGTANFADRYDPETEVTNLSPGENILEWTISYGNSASSSTSSSQVTIINNQPDQPFAGNDVADCKDNYILQGNIPDTDMGSPLWTIITGGGDIANDQDPNSSVTNLAKGTNTFVYTITKGDCILRDTVEIINGLPTLPDAGDDDAICTDSYLLKPNTPNHGTARWLAGSTGGARFEGNTVYDLAPGENELIYEIYTDWCSLEDRVIITNNAPTESYAGPSRNVCDPTYVLEAEAAQYGEGTWVKVSGSGVIDAADIHKANAVVTNLGSGSNRFRWVIDNNGCTSSSEVEIIYDFVEADAGDDDIICDSFTQLKASNPLPGTGTWGIKGGSGTAVFEDPSDPLTVVTNLDRGENILTWTVTNGNCSDVSEVSITNNKPTVPDAGQNQPLCEPSTYLQGNEDVVGDGYWTVISGSASFESSTYADAQEDPYARISGLTFGENILRWTITNEGCTLYDDVQISYNRVDANAGNDVQICSDETILEAVNPSPGIGSWSVPGGQGSAVFEDSSSPNTKVSKLGRGVNTLRWTVLHNGCSTYDDVVVENLLPSTPYAGNTQTTCDDFVTLDADEPTNGSVGYWDITTGSAVFEDRNKYNTKVTDLGEGDNIFVWTTKKVDGCTLSDQVLIVNNNPSDPYAGADYEEICSSTFTLKATDPEYGTGIWSIEQGGGNLSDPNDPNAVISTLSQGTNVLRWTVSQGNCSKFSEIEIVNNTPTSANAGPDIEDCKDEQILDANVPIYYDDAYWELISGYGELDDINNPKTTVRNLTFGENEFQWVIKKGNCTLADRVVIFNKIPDKAFAGSDQPDVCDTYTILNANDPATGSGKWSVIKGKGTFEDAEKYDTKVSDIGFGENIYRWEVAYGECSTVDEVAIISNRTEAYAGEDQIVYDPVAVLNANNAGDLDARWLIVGTSTAAFENETFFNTSVNNLSEGINTFGWEINVNGCISYDQVSIDYRPVPDAGFITDVEEGCYPLTVQFTNYSVGGSVYQWSFGDGSTSGDRNPVYTYTQPGEYTVQLKAPGPDGMDGIFTKKILVYDHPKADFAVNPQVVYIPGEKARFYDLSSDAVSWKWDFGDGNTSTERNPSYEYTDEGVFDIMLAVANNDGCVDTLIVENAILAEPQGFVVFPNAFKPRASNATGQIDPSSEYVIVFKPAYRDVDSFTLEIFNRWGQKIYETNDIDSGWDGMYDGQLAPQAVYIYKATGKYYNGREFRKSGSVLLVR